MNVASLELCKELYELSGWNWMDTYFVYKDGEVVTKPSNPIFDCPAYDLGYLLRKLPEEVTGDDMYSHYGLGLCPVSIVKPRKVRWACFYQFAGQVATQKKRELEFVADTPEDASCSLAIELFKQGVLSHD